MEYNSRQHHVYRTPFTLTTRTHSLEAAQEFFAQQEYTSDLSAHLAARHGEFMTERLVASVSWNLEAVDRGYVQLETTRQLSRSESNLVSQWLHIQHAQGLGMEMAQEFDVEEATTFDWIADRSVLEHIGLVEDLINTYTQTCDVALSDDDLRFANDHTILTP